MKLIYSILLIVIMIGSAFICVKQPKMHSRVMVFDSQYTIVEDDKNTVEQNISTEEMPTMVADDGEAKTETFFEEDETLNNETNNAVKSVKEVPNTKTLKQEKKNEIKKEVAPQKKVVNTKPEIKETAKTVKTPQTTVDNAMQKTVSNEIQQTVQKPTQKVLTAQEEEIAWNIWRSNLQNQIMKDTHLPAIPLGTIFKISFDVDKYGRVSNVQTWSTNPKYTPYAIEHIAPVIRSYQGKSILDFPSGSQRTKTTFTGGWRISQNSRYSTPANYNDIEKVTK